MSANSVETKLKTLILAHAPMPISPEEIKDDSNLLRDLAYDSVQLVRLVVEIESEFGIDVGDEMLGLDTLTEYRTLRDYVASHVLPASASLNQQASL